MTQFKSSSALKIVNVPIGCLKPYKNNPRKDTKEQTRFLKENIEKFGIVKPLVVNSAPKRNNVVLGGHFRLKVLKELKYKRVPVVYVNIPDAKKEEELVLRLNKNTGEWDYDLLKAFDVDFLEDIGFDTEDFEMIFGNDEVFDDEFNAEKAIEEAELSPRAKTGDLFQLGNHRVMCGDSTNSNHIKKLLESSKESQKNKTDTKKSKTEEKVTIDMLYTDPPYNIGLDYNKGMSGKKKYGGKVEDSKPDTEYKSFLAKVLTNVKPYLNKDSHVFMYCDQKYVGLIQNLYEQQQIAYKRTCLWIKNGANPTPKVAFNKAYEPCVYGTLGSPYLSKNHTKYAEVLNKEISEGNRRLDDVQDMFDIWLVSRLHGQDYQHPTEKPVTLHEKPLKRCTKVGDTVLDLFGGSGSTLMACEQLSRKAFVMEISPVFIEVILQRWEEATGRKAVLISSSKN